MKEIKYLKRVFSLLRVFFANIVGIGGVLHIRELSTLKCEHQLIESVLVKEHEVIKREDLIYFFVGSLISFCLFILLCFLLLIRRSFSALRHVPPSL